jgi:histidyl-tRNA synthetase
MKIALPKGTRDFNPSVMLRRNYIIDTIREIYKKYGYKQIETPAMENISTLTGKYGDEGDQLLFKILNSRLHDSKKKDELLEIFKNSLNSNIVSELLTERALRYDLTVPFARYVVMHRNDITFPFKRYQVQPVWRADRPQKGRYREFYQCDADVIGSTSLLNEAELVMIMNDVFNEFQLPVTIKINNRKVLAGIAEVSGQSDKLIDITVAIDKLDKIGKEKVIDELKAKGLSSDSLRKIEPFFDFKGTTAEKLDFLKTQLSTSDTGLTGVGEIEKVAALAGLDTLEIDITLARGLNYYTGAIFEVKANNTTIGSVCGGGRYDDLTGIFGLQDVSGVGISFGIDRIYDVMTEQELFEKTNLQNESTQVFFINFGADELKYCLDAATQLRHHGISTEVYPDAVKIKKQMAYANANNIPWVIIIGSDEINSGTLTVKNMESGEQNKMSIEALISSFNKN